MDIFVKNGGCIITVSSELPEILGISDRIIVMREGILRGELSREEATEHNVIELASLHEWD
jgi:ABC-type sugar transport system ATPase subunit